MKYFCYDPDIGFNLYDTAEQAQTAAADSISQYADEAAEGWPDEVNHVCWGEVKEVAAESNRRPDNSGVNDYICDYELAPIDHVPAADPRDAEIAALIGERDQLRIERDNLRAEITAKLYGDGPRSYNGLISERDAALARVKELESKWKEEQTVIIEGRLVGGELNDNGVAVWIHGEVSELRIPQARVRLIAFPAEPINGEHRVAADGAVKP